MLVVVLVMGIVIFGRINGNTTRPGATAPNAVGGGLLVGVGPSQGGISIYSPLSGRPLRELTAPPFGHFPFLSPNGSSVYFTTSTPGSETCESDIEKKLIDGKSHPIVQGQQINAFTMTSYRHWALWLSSSAGCNPRPPYALHKMNVKTGQTQVKKYRTFVESMAVTANGSELALEQQALAVPLSQSTTKIYLYAWASATPEASPANVLPCPKGASECTQASPAFTQNGELFYVASIGPHDVNCADRECATQRFMLVRIHQHKAIQVASVVAPSFQTYLAVSPSGNEAVLSIGNRSYFWKAGHGLVHIARLYEESW
ncbi:MAG: hypothetical protein MP439_05640 [Ferrimicrobium sp.]|nr:hypothetical protein [Ferrimicrobium sp.]